MVQFELARPWHQPDLTQCAAMSSLARSGPASTVVADIWPRAAVQHNA